MPETAGPGPGTLADDPKVEHLMALADEIARHSPVETAVRQESGSLPRLEIGAERPFAVLAGVRHYYALTVDWRLGPVTDPAGVALRLAELLPRKERAHDGP